MSRRRRAIAGGAIAVVAAAAVAVVLATSSGPPAAPPGLPSPFPPRRLGAAVNRLFNDGIYTPAQINAQLAALASTGATLARSDALWEASEPARPVRATHHYDWRFDDTIAGSLAAHGLRWLPIIDYSPAWTRSVAGQDHSPPASLADYAAYAAAVARRYGTGGSFWRTFPELAPEPVETYEIWNEPDSPLFWYPQPDAAAYADLYLHARDAIKAVQPGARVIVGGLSQAADFIPALLRTAPSLARQLDGVAIHPYGPNPQAVVANVRRARAALAGFGLSQVPLYVTEFGWATRPAGNFDYAPEALRPGYIEQTLSALGHLDCGLAAAVLYAWLTPERNPSDLNDWFGINPPAGGGGPDVRAFEAGLRAAVASAPRISCG